MKTPKVSVYITNYNYASFVRQAIESVLNQTYESFELIIIDDGSKDNSREIISEYRSNPKVRIFFQENKGLNATNNIALHAAKGIYLMRLDADDYLDSNALLVMASILDGNEKIALVFPDYYYVNKKGEIQGQERRHDFENDVLLLDQPAHGACTMLRRSAILEVKGYSSEFVCQDGYDLWLKLTKSYLVRNTNLPLFYYRKHGHNLTNNQELIHRTRSEIIKKHAESSQHVSLKPIAVIPVLGPAFNPYCVSYQMLMGRPVINWTIDELLRIEDIADVLVTSPDEELLKMLKINYGESIKIHHRSPEGSTEINPYESSIYEALSKVDDADENQSVMILNIEYPLRTRLYIEKAINVMRIYDVDVVVGVSVENDIFFNHTGSGLKVIGNELSINSMRIERDYIYRQVGGMKLLKSKKDLLGSGSLVNKRIGHVLINRLGSFQVTSDVDIKIATVLVENS